MQLCDDCFYPFCSYTYPGVSIYYTAKYQQIHEVLEWEEVQYNRRVKNIILIIWNLVSKYHVQ